VSGHEWALVALGFAFGFLLALTFCVLELQRITKPKGRV
jgi:hypothetical protein